METTLTLNQEKQLASLRKEMKEILNQNLKVKFSLLLFTFYPTSAKFGVSVIIPTRKIYFAKASSMLDLAKELSTAISLDEYAVKPEMISVILK